MDEWSFGNAVDFGSQALKFKQLAFFQMSIDGLDSEALGAHLMVWLGHGTIPILTHSSDNTLVRINHIIRDRSRPLDSVDRMFQTINTEGWLIYWISITEK